MKFGEDQFKIFEQDGQDSLRLQDKYFLEHSDLTEIILDSCFNLMNDLGVGFLINLGKRNIQYKRLCHPDYYRAAVGDPAHLDQ